MGRKRERERDRERERQREDERGECAPSAPRTYPQERQRSVDPCETPTFITVRGHCIPDDRKFIEFFRALRISQVSRAFLRFFPRTIQLVSPIRRLFRGNRKSSSGRAGILEISSTETETLRWNSPLFRYRICSSPRGERSTGDVSSFRLPSRDSSTNQASSVRPRDQGRELQESPPSMTTVDKFADEAPSEKVTFARAIHYLPQSM